MAHSLKAHGWIAIGQPIGSIGDVFNGHGQALVLLKMAGKSLQGMQAAPRTSGRPHRRKWLGALPRLTRLRNWNRLMAGAPERW